MGVGEGKILHLSIKYTKVCMWSKKSKYNKHKVMNCVSVPNFLFIGYLHTQWNSFYKNYDSMLSYQQQT